MARFNRLALLLVLIASLVLPTVAQDPTATPDPAAATPDPADTVVPADDSVAFVVFAHASVDAGPIDIYIDGTDANGADMSLTPVATGLAFGDSTDLMVVPAGTRTISAREAGAAADSDPLVSVTWDFVGNSTWVIAGVGLMETSSFLLEPVTVVRTPTNGMARVRVINQVADIETLSVSGAPDGANFADALGWAGVQDTEVEPGTYQLQVTDGAEGTFGDAQSFDFAADTIYTIFLTGSTAMGPEVDFLVIELPQDETRVQFINERSDAIDVHMRPGDELVVSLDAGATSEWLTIPSTAATFIAFMPGTGPAGQEQASLATQLRPGRDVTIVFRADGSVEVVEEVLTPMVSDSDDNTNTNTNDNANTNTNDNSADNTNTNTNTNDNSGNENSGNDNSGGGDNGNENDNDNGNDNS
jgi:hypothetical protein